jgi:hypothetical protein
MLTRLRTAAGVLSAVVVVVVVLSWLGFRLGANPDTLAGTSAQAHAVDQQVIDSKTQPAAAAQALDDNCQPIANCKFVGTSPVAVAFSAPRILGDRLFNCGQSDSEDAVTVSEELSESTSLQESLSAKVSLGFLGLAKSSIEAEVNSQQLQEVSTETTDESSVLVPPQWKGWTQTQVSEASITGDATVADGIHLIKVTGLDLTFPGYARTGEVGIRYEGVRTPMTAAEIHDRCGALPTTRAGSRSARR